MRRLMWLVGFWAMAGCSVLPGIGPKAQTPAASPTSTPAASAGPGTPEGIAAFLKDYVKRNNAANKAMSAKLLAGYEGGSSLAIDKAGYLSQLKLGDRDHEPFGYDQPTPTVAAVKGGGWFVTTAYWKGKSETAKEPTYLLFARDGESWLQMYAPDVFSDQAVDELPEIAKDASGAAVEVAQADAAGLMMSPAAFARSYAAHLVGKGAAASKSRFAADRLTTGAASTRVKMAPYAKLTESARPAAAYPSYAVRTADGGALAFTTVERTRRYDVRQGPQRNYVQQKNSGFLPGKYYTYMKFTELIQIVAYIPPKTAGPGQVEVIGSYSGITSGSGH
ncbi:hypothetical protein AB0K40_39775 [Nonomuraea bangladeshensis]|uniref:DUF8094 domain-containing protein n=1 Tax=Nonomuraea bangladeshensis TaxID=404385 RepID=A0ABV3HGK8_9ACTN